MQHGTSTISYFWVFIQQPITELLYALRLKDSYFLFAFLMDIEYITQKIVVSQ
jgi:hypothetical protein